MKLAIFIIAIAVIAVTADDYARVYVPVPHDLWERDWMQRYISEGIDSMLAKSKAKGEIDDDVTVSLDTVLDIYRRRMATRTYYKFLVGLNFDGTSKAQAVFTVDYNLASKEVKTISYEFHTLDPATETYVVKNYTGLDDTEYVSYELEKLLIEGAESALKGITAIDATIPKAYYLVSGIQILGTQAISNGNFYLYQIDLEGMDNDYIINLIFLIKTKTGSDKKELVFYSYDAFNPNAPVDEDPQRPDRPAPREKPEEVESTTDKPSRPTPQDTEPLLGGEDDDAEPDMSGEEGQ